MWYLGSEPVEEILFELRVEAAHVRHYAQLVHVRIGHVVGRQQRWDRQILLRYLGTAS